MTMWLPLSLDPSKPRYLAIADALARDAGSGVLAPGVRLPTQRELADRLGVTTGTVTRAYAVAAQRGVLAGEVGRGTFVRAPAGLPAAASEPPAQVDLSVNHPAPPSAAVRQYLAQALEAVAADPRLGTLMAYPPDAGLPEHREAGALWIAQAGLENDPQRVLVSSGIQHGMTAVLTASLEPGDVLLTERLTYPGLRALAGLLHLRLRGLPMDEHGLLPQALAEACRSGAAKALYCVPTLHNPTVAVMPEARRREIAAIARHHGLAILEDDVHGRLVADAPPSLASFAPERTYYLTGTAKCLAPGLRVGFVLAPPGRLTALAAALRATAWMAAPLMAEVAARWIRDGTAADIIERQRSEAAQRAALARARLGALLASQPGAYHGWLTLPDTWRSESFTLEAARRGVRVTPSTAFFVGRGSAPRAFRVCFGAPAQRRDLERGLDILAELLDGPGAASAVV